MKVGTLEFKDIADQFELVAATVREMIQTSHMAAILAAESDAELADTAAYCKHYEVDPLVCANCVVVEAKRGDRVWYAACVILATNQADVNGAIRRQLNARKTSFAPMSKAVTMTGMEYGGITPIGLPADWPILIDTQVAASERVIIGSGIRGSKLFVPGKSLAELPNSVVMDIIKST